MKHSAYNLTTKEVLCSNSSHELNRQVKIRTKINRADGIKNRWVFSHNDVDGIVEKIRKDQAR